MIQNKKSAADLTIINATQQDHEQLAQFLNLNNRLHRHLDWFGMLDWLGSDPFLIEKVDDNIQAVLCAAPENTETAWVRTFGVCKQQEIKESWLRLLARAVQKLRDMRVERLAALALHPWFEGLLIDSGFINHQDIIVLEWQGDLPPSNSYNPDVIIRPMQVNDLPDVERIDRLAFPSLWQNSRRGLKVAYQQTGICTVAEINNIIVGYQISTSMTIYGHLARLAVNPALQRQKIGSMLVYDLLKQFKNQGFWKITVNTQSDNLSSLKLYETFGFKRTSEVIPVFELVL